ncbi:winged helix-turn-helix domain-containing protein [Asanoa sp. WMMD1127]|uniref:winged helix-turn-helix domain-containing protein n=1 Tax=Asanoa sp. WMMD1127 TaxID=3016107 RepID=UPI0024163DC4|nr:winged helix-turn-helix domain-containing protein [Asanoa sp. WMMD1127]MDG4820524.1 winged helix-turn-helix domain-containing protein [Asanoa sp. WMMD1127]
MPHRPSYLDIVDDIRQQIVSGQLAPGATLPTCREMCVTYQVSRQTVGSAMIVLRTQGLIVGHQGRAVYVTADPHRIPSAANPAGSESPHA